jgi:hypothetical protein
MEMPSSTRTGKTADFVPAEATVFLPGGHRERTIVYEAPFDRCDREQDYATVWEEFETRN